MWGLTECSSNAAINPPETLRPARSASRCRASSCGSRPTARSCCASVVMKATAASPRRPPRRSTPTAGYTQEMSERSTADGYLRIIDRKEELLINSAGKNMCDPIESAIKGRPR